MASPRAACIARHPPQSNSRAGKHGCFPGCLAHIVKRPKFGPLIFRVPAMVCVLKEHIRSFARDFSSSRLAPPKAMSNWCFVNACFNASVFITQHDAPRRASGGQHHSPIQRDCVNNQVETKLLHPPVAKGNHLTNFHWCPHEEI